MNETTKIPLVECVGASANERFAYDDYKTDLDAGISCGHPAGDERGEGEPRSSLYA